MQCSWMGGGESVRCGPATIEPIRIPCQVSCTVEDAFVFALVGQLTLKGNAEIIPREELDPMRLALGNPTKPHVGEKVNFPY